LFYNNNNNNNNNNNKEPGQMFNLPQRPQLNTTSPLQEEQL